MTRSSASTDTRSPAARASAFAVVTRRSRIISGAIRTVLRAVVVRVAAATRLPAPGVVLVIAVIVVIVAIVRARFLPPHAGERERARR